MTKNGRPPLDDRLNAFCKDSDAYLAEWRKAAPFSVEGEPGDIADSQAARLEEEYDQERLKTLIANDGWA